MKINKKINQDNSDLDKTIKFLVSEIEKYCNNKKPLVTHSIRTAFRLDLYGYGKEVVQAALLHDLLEDTKASIKEIEKRFGKRVASLVMASTFDKSISDKKERYKTNFNKAIKAGDNALVIRASDLLDNSFYYSLVDNQNEYNHLLEKLSYFLKLSVLKIGREKIYKDLEGRLLSLKNK